MLGDQKPVRKKKRKKHGKSIIQEDWSRCYLCSLEGNHRNAITLHTHHVIFGAGRREKSEEDGLTVRLCAKHHEQVHKCGDLRRVLSYTAQKAWENENRQRYGDETRQKWIERYGRSYIMD